MEINPIVIQELIQYLNKMFSNFHYNFTFPHSLKRDSFSYYLTKHCYSFARILMTIFPDSSLQYVSDSHVIVKIGDYFFDVRGLLTDIDLSEYHMVDKDDLYVNTVFNNTDELEKKMEIFLIQYGKMKLDELLNRGFDYLKI